MTDPRTKLTAIHNELKHLLFERDHVLIGSLAALLAGEHILLLGPPGTAKSLLAQELCTRISSASYFAWLLTRFSTPEELFGPISLKALEDDRYERVTTSKLPHAHIAFLDEIFKANSAILNALLSLINERVFYNGNHATPVPLISLFAASNELPEEGELLALFDRFMVRYTVEYIQEDFRFLKMLSLQDKPPQNPPTTLSLDELRTLQKAVEHVELHQGYLGDLVDLRRRLNARGISASDRRWRRSIHLLKAFAYVQGRDAVGQEDMLHLQHVLWNEPDQRATVAETLQTVFYGHDQEAQQLLIQAREIRDFARRHWDNAEDSMRASIEAHTKLKRVHHAAQQILRSARDRGRDTEKVRECIQRIENIQKKILMENT